MTFVARLNDVLQSAIEREDDFLKKRVALASFLQYLLDEMREDLARYANYHVAPKYLCPSKHVASAFPDYRRNLTTD